MADLRNINFFEDGLSYEIWRDALMPALELYPALFDGDVFIPEDFVVPSEAPWPERAWGIKLGYIVKTINSRRIFREEMQQDKQRLKELGYAWESLFGKWAKELLPALRIYKAKFGHCDVPSWWVVPTNDESWPKTLRGYQLGKQVVRIRRNGRTSTDAIDVLPELEAIGFKFNAFESYFVDRVLPALEVYAEIYGDTHVPQGFIVPSEGRWPQPSWGRSSATPCATYAIATSTHSRSRCTVIVSTRSALCGASTSPRLRLDATSSTRVSRCTRKSTAKTRRSRGIL